MCITTKKTVDEPSLHLYGRPMDTVKELNTYMMGNDGFIHLMAVIVGLQWVEEEKPEW